MEIRTAAEIGMLIKERRRELRLDQRTLAERIGVSRQWIIEVEKGKPRAEIGLVLRTLNVLGIALDGHPAVIACGDYVDEIIDRAKRKPW